MRFDPFEFYRFVLAVAVGAYATFNLISAIWHWRGFVGGSARSAVMFRRYVILQLLRVRIHRFTPDLIAIAALSLVLALLIARHWR